MNVGEFWVAVYELSKEVYPLRSRRHAMEKTLEIRRPIERKRVQERRGV